MIKFNVKNQIIERQDNFRVVADSKNYLTADFVFSDEWDNQRVFASFFHIDVDVAKVAEIKDGQCIVPWEIIKPPFFSVSLFCGDLITSNVVNIKVEASGLKDGEPAGTPTPTVWEQYVKEIEQHAKKLENIDIYAQTAEEARATFDKKDDGSGYDLLLEIPRGSTGAQGYTPKRGTDYWTEGDKAEIVADTAKSLNASFTQTLSDATDYTDNVFAASIKSVTYNPDSAVFTFTKGDNTDIVIDLPIEATVKNGYYDDAQKELVLVLVNDFEIRIPASGLIADYDGCATGTIRCSVSADNIISCNIVSGSITKTLLTTELQEEINAKANRQTTLAGYGIADAYTKAEVDAKTAYASEAQRGTVRVWTTYDGDEVVLNISTEDADDEA